MVTEVKAKKKKPVLLIILLVAFGVVLLGTLGYLIEDKENSTNSQNSQSNLVLLEPINNQNSEPETIVSNTPTQTTPSSEDEKSLSESWAELWESSSEENKEGEGSEVIEEIEEEQIERSINELESIFGYYSELSEIQKEEIYETEYKNKIIKTSITADKIDEASLNFLTGDYVVQEMYGAPYYSQYSSRVAVFFPSSEKDKLLEVNIGNEIVFIGKLTGYNNRLEFTDAMLL